MYSVVGLAAGKRDRQAVVHRTATATAMAETTPRSVSYRYDLDGLRGIAIAFVVIFHVFVGKVSGGVDVFLLLSGYFFLGSQLRYATRTNASVNPWWPLWRTIRRLMPALVLVLGVTATIGMALAPQLRRMEIVEQRTASLLYFQNWALAGQEADYNVASGTVSPLQHLWSMSVQGQFYLMAIAVAMIIIWTRRAGIDLYRYVGPLLVAVTVVSFAYAWWMQGESQTLNYYSTWSRMWQMTLGALLALYGSYIRLPMRISILFTWVGLAMVLSTGLIFDGAVDFPGPWALYPLGGAVLIILGGGHGMLAAGLAHKSMRWLGDIAYPLYLWHWPILIIALIVLDSDTPTFLLGIGVIALSVVLADLTHRGVEKPLQQHAKRPVRGERRVQQAWRELNESWQPRLRAITGVAVVAVLAVMLGTHVQAQARMVSLGGEALDPVTYPGAMALTGAFVPDVEPKPELELADPPLSTVWDDECISRFEDDPTILQLDIAGDVCLYGNTEATTEVYLVGGSHSAHWLPALDRLGLENGFKVVPLLRQSCPTFVEERDGVFSPECITFNEQVIQRITEVQPDLVVGTTTRPMIERGSFVEELPASYFSLWDYLEGQGIPFAGLRDNPWWVNEDGSQLSVPLCALEQGVEDCAIDYDDFYQPTDPAAPHLNHRPGMKAIDSSKWLCVDGKCPIMIGNTFVYRDGNHLTNMYSHSLAPLMWEEIRELL